MAFGSGAQPIPTILNSPAGPGKIKTLKGFIAEFHSVGGGNARRNRCAEGLCPGRTSPRTPFSPHSLNLAKEPEKDG